LTTIALLALSVIASEQRVWVDSADRVFRDTEGRNLIMHGVNVVYKVAPYIPDMQVFEAQDSLSAKDIADL